MVGRSRSGKSTACGVFKVKKKKKKKKKFNFFNRTIFFLTIFFFFFFFKKDPCYETKEMSIFSDTVHPDFSSFSLDRSDENNAIPLKYTFNIIDTPGLKEVKPNGITPRDDEKILETIKYCLRNEITKINVLLIFVSFDIGMNTEDVVTIKTFFDKFDNGEIKICIVITRAEDKTKTLERKFKK